MFYLDVFPVGVVELMLHWVNCSSVEVAMIPEVVGLESGGSLPSGGSQKQCHGEVTQDL